MTKKDKMSSGAGSSMGEAARGHQGATSDPDQGAHYAAQGNKQTTGQIREHMEVIASCGTKIGAVDRVEGNAVKLTKKDSSDGQHHFIPLNWVNRVDNNQVHLTKNSKEAEHDWKPTAAECGCG